MDTVQRTFMAFHGSEPLKRAVITRVQQLLDAEVIEQNHISAKDGAKALISELLASSQNNNFTLFSEALGIPEWAAILYQSIFESLSPASARTWAIEFLRAIPVGSDLNDLKLELYRGLLTDSIFGVKYLKTVTPEFIQIVEEFEHNNFQYLAAQDQTWCKAVEARIDHVDNTSPVPFHLFQLHCASLTLGWMLIDHPLEAVVTCVSAHLTALSWWELQLHGLRLGSGELGPALPTWSGGIGYAYRSEIELQYEKLGKLIIDRAKSINTTTPIIDSSLLIDKIRDQHHALSLLKLDGEISDYVPVETIPLPPNKPIHFPTIRERFLSHAILKISGYVLSAVGWLGIGICALYIFQSQQGQFLDLIGNSLRLILYMLLLLVSRAILILGRKLIPGDGWYRYLKNPENAILYLRSFHDDEHQEFRSSRNPILSLLVPGLTVEEELIQALAGLGNVIAVGDPASKFARGAARISLAKNWENYVVEYMKHAKFVVISLGYGKFVRSELSWARQLLTPQKVILHIPEHRWREFVEYRRGRNLSSTDGELRSIETFLSEIIHLYLGNWIDTHKLSHRSHFLWCRPGWRLMPLYAYNESSDWLFGSHKRQYRVELEPIYKKFAAPSN